jgi:hypothetical protein
MSMPSFFWPPWVPYGTNTLPCSGQAMRGGGGVAATVASVLLASAAAGLSGVGWPAAVLGSDAASLLAPGGGGRVSRFTGPGAVAAAAWVAPPVLSATKRAPGSSIYWPAFRV